MPLPLVPLDHFSGGRNIQRGESQTDDDLAPLMNGQILVLNDTSDIVDETDTVLTEGLLVEAGKTILYTGNLSIGTGASPITTDETLLHLRTGGRVIVLGNMEVHRDVAAATALMHIQNGRLIVFGTFNGEHAGGGGAYGIWMDGGGRIDCESAATLTTDNTSGGWGVGIYAINGTSSMRWRGGLTVNTTGAGMMSIACWECDFFVGDFETYAGDLVVNSDATDTFGYGVAVFTYGTFKVVGNCTVTADSVVTGGGGLVVRTAPAQVLTTLSVSMTSKTDGKLLWALHRLSHFTVYSIGTLTPSGSATQATIQVEENGHFEVQGPDTFTGNGGTIKISQQSSAYFNSPSLGTSGDPVTIDVPCLDVDDSSEIYTEGVVSMYRDVAATTPLWRMRGNSKADIETNVTLSRLGAGAGGVIDCDGGSYVKLNGLTNLLAHGGAIAADGSFIKASNQSRVFLNRVQFNGGADLDLGAFASVLMESGSDISVTDAAGASDAINSNAGAGTRGIKLKGGSKAHLPAWAANAGIGVQGASAGFDHECGGLAPANYAGSEILTDVAAGTPELCLLNKP